MPEEDSLDALVSDYAWHDRETQRLRQEIKDRRDAAALYDRGQVVEANVSIRWGTPATWRKARIEYSSPEVRDMSYIVRVRTSAGNWSHRAVRAKESEIRPIQTKQETN